MLKVKQGGSRIYLCVRVCTNLLQKDVVVEAYSLSRLLFDVFCFDGVTTGNKIWIEKEVLEVLCFPIVYFVHSVPHPTPCLNLYPEIGSSTIVSQFGKFPLR